MDQAQKNAIMMVLNTWWKDQTCEICKNKVWSLSEDLVTPVLLENGGLQLGKKAYPQAMAICVHCGNTKYFNVQVTGALREPEKKEEKGILAPPENTEEKSVT